MGGGFFDNMWDPYSGAYAYPRPRYYRPRGAQAVSVPETRSSYKVEEPLKKMSVKTIPVTDGDVPAPVAQVPVKPRFESEDAAATKIQAVYRGYAVHKTQPLKHLREIKKVKEELENFQGKLQETEQRKKLCSDSQERLRWTEGTMALLLRLDSLQGVHPEVRLIRKALTRELIRFQEAIDSLSVESTQLNGQEDVSTVENTDAKVIDATAAEGMEIEESTSLDQELSGADFASVGAIESDSDIKEYVPQVHSDMNDQVDSVAIHCYDDQSEPLLPDESMIEEESVVEPSSTEEAHAEVPMGVENISEQILTTVPPQDVEVELAASSQNVPYRDIESDDREDSEIVVIAPPRDVASEPEEASVIPNVEMCEQAPDIERGEEVEMAEEAGRPALDTFQSDDGNSKNVPSTDAERDNQEDSFVVAAPSGDVISEPEDASITHVETCEQATDGGSEAEKMAEDPGADISLVMTPSEDVISEAIDASVTPVIDSAEMCEQAPDMGRSGEEIEEDKEDTGDMEEAETMAEEASRPALETFQSGDASASECMDAAEGCMIPATSALQSMSLEPQRLQVGQPSDDHINGLSDRALLLQVLEENRRLRDVVGKVLQWGKHQNDVIHDLVSRIERLEEPSNLLHGEENNGGRKKIANGRRSEKGHRRSGKAGHNRPRLGYIDSEDWLSAESDDYF